MGRAVVNPHLPDQRLLDHLSDLGRRCVRLGLVHCSTRSTPWSTTSRGERILPECRDDVDWGSVEVTEVSSVHVCLQSNEDGGDPRAEVLLKSNRSTYQIVTKPTTAEFVWVEDDFWFSDLVSPYLGADGSHVLLRGGKQTSFGFRQRPDDMDFPLAVYQSKRIIVFNGILALLGGVDSDEIVLAALLLTFRCVSDLGAFDGSVVETATELLEAGFGCVVDILKDEESAGRIVEAVVAEFEFDDAARFVSVAKKGVSALAPAAKLVSKGTILLDATVNSWDTIFDNAAEGRISVHFDGSGPRECRPERFSDDLGFTTEVNVEVCEQGWALIDLCGGSTDDPCADGRMIVRQQDGVWLVATSFPSGDCPADLSSVGAPDSVLAPIQWPSRCDEDPQTTGDPLVQFVTAWNARDWAAMSTVADQASVAVAQEWATDSGTVYWPPGTQRCMDMMPDEKWCELAYDDGAGGFLFLFGFKIRDDRIVELVPTGDAG